ncbi:MAG TPA: amino acid adenylation domain-containing protein [Acidimicrobiales bacterium]|jgi:amino acid adenylation domain-containing protein|nr:amino acid adenylation domain-containing protein [Acidimicrobiales bacterium]
MTQSAFLDAASPEPEGEPSVLSGRTVQLDQGTLVDAVAEHARSRPDHPALHDGERPSQTYAELWDDATRLAGSFREAGVGPGDQVAVWATRSAPVVAAMLGSMILGAAYAPIDPTYPAARVRRILEVAQPRVIVCPDARALAGSLPRGVPTVDTHADARSTPVATSVAQPGDVAYTVFTTGSTGLPKGVLVNHRSLLNYLGWAQELTGFEPEDSTPCFASLGFDHAVTCLWLPLWVGGSVQLIPDSWDPRPWLAGRDRPFAFIKITPSHVRLFERIARPDYRSVTRTLMFGGERLDAGLVASLGERVEGVRLLNHYGPTEATVGCTAYRFDSGAVGGEGALPIGTPVWNSRAYVADPDLRPVPEGQEGELVLAGDCVANGYLGGSGTDRARFVDESFLADGRSGPAYRTGDRAVLRDGLVDCLGRLDEQVKVRGHRIEIQEVNDLAVAVDGVAQAAVAVRKVGLGGLELFVVVDQAGTGEDGDGVLVSRVLEHLRAQLPAAAVPERVWIVPELVVNAHGKWDPEATRAQVERETGAGS